MNLYTSNRIERLAQQLSLNLTESILAPFEKEIIIVQSKGMERWLNTEIARYNSIAANIEYPFPRAFVYRLFRAILSLDEITPYSIEIMTWNIMKLLPEMIHKPDFEPIHYYLQGINPEINRFQLAQKIAQTFDNYLIFRPEMILEWDRGENHHQEWVHSSWQMLLWQQLSETYQQPHSAALKSTLIQHIQQGLPIQGIPKRVSIFGISFLPPYYMEIFYALSYQIQVDFYYLNPCREYWELAYSAKQLDRIAVQGMTDEDQYFNVENSLLSALGQSGREFFSLIINQYGDMGDIDLFESLEEDTLLSKIQSDILNLNKRTMNNAEFDNIDPSSFIPEHDRSVQLHSCHSAIREIEVLYDTLLYLFEHHSEILPKDVVVMMPDVSSYAPLIQAVFDTPEQDNMYIPYSIADRNLQTHNSLAHVFLLLLTLNQERFKTRDVINVLEYKWIHKKFDLNENDIERIKSWVQDTQIAWGIDGHYRKNLDLPEYFENSWFFGLERMLLGYAMIPAEDKSTFLGILPYGEIEGDHAKTLGCFAKFLEDLFSLHEKLRQTRTIDAWSSLLSQLLNDFFLQDTENENEFLTIRDILIELADYSNISGFTEQVSLTLVSTYLSKRFTYELATSGFITTGVTFCTLLPMRSIPFKVVYLLGMNDGEYPRSAKPVGFDITEKHRKMGDRSKRNEDRYLFLEALLSAREYFIISYIGQSIRDNSAMPPSVLVSELCDYIHQGFISEHTEAILSQLTTHHPLQPFNQNYFTDHSKWFTYSKANYLAFKANTEHKQFSEPFFNKPLPAIHESEFEWNQITIEQLCHFFRNPAKFLIEKRLNTILDLKLPASFLETEPFELNALDKYGLLEQMLSASTEENNVSNDDYFHMLKAQGKLPHGGLGELSYQRLACEAGDFLDTIQSITGATAPYMINNQFPVVSVSLVKPSVTLSAKLKCLYPKGQVFFRPAKIKAYDYLRAWIYHLVLNSDEFDIPEVFAKQTYLIGKKNGAIGKKNGLLIFKPMDYIHAKTYLSELVDLFFQGLHYPLCFFPSTSHAYASSFKQSQKKQKALQEASKEWYNGYLIKGESENPYVQKVFGETMPETDEFTTLALRVFKPIMSNS
ncbi:MAG: exodeoxyribonuclease V subunit gamma [Desulfobacterales bacterium]|nr:exodeoxyribonuclease V subunit gamma [Desulfobacterales bacterium]